MGENFKPSDKKRTMCGRNRNPASTWCGCSIFSPVERRDIGPQLITNATSRAARNQQRWYDLRYVLVPIIGGDDDLADAGWVLNEIQPRRMTHQTDLSLFNIIFRWDVPA